MKAPDKIFYTHLCINPSGYVQGTAYEQKPLTEFCVEYIRKDLISDFADAVRRYVSPKKGDAFCSRSELMQKLNELQKLIEQ